MVPPDSDGISRVPPYSGTRVTRVSYISHTGLSPSLADRSRSLPLCADHRAGQAPLRPYNPEDMSPVWAPPISLAATLGISFDFFSWSYLDVSVHSVGLYPPMNSVGDDGALPPPGFPIRAPPDLCLRAAPRSFSQLITPFLACPCQGIHRAPFSA